MSWLVNFDPVVKSTVDLTSSFVDNFNNDFHQNSVDNINFSWISSSSFSQIKYFSHFFISFKKDILDLLF